MKELALNDRPREKLLTHGPAALGDNELLAVVLGSGRRHSDALAVAICIANSERAGGPEGAAVLDRSAIAPIARGESAYDRAVREAIARERSETGRSAGKTAR